MLRTAKGLQTCSKLKHFFMLQVTNNAMWLKIQTVNTLQNEIVYLVQVRYQNYPTFYISQLILHLVQNHLGGLSKIVLNGNKIRRSTVNAIKTYLRENHLDTESECTSSDLDIETSSAASEATLDTISSKVRL